MKQSKTLFALLGWLRHESLTGYDLKKRCEEYLGDFWYGSFGQIYPLLKEMMDAGLVTMREEEGVGGHPARKVYTITEKGIRRFEEWLGERAEPDLYRSEMMLKLFFGREAPPELLIEQISEFLETNRKQERELSHYLENPPPWMHENNPNAPFIKIIIERGLIVSRGYVEWCESTVETLRGLR